MLKSAARLALLTAAILLVPVGSALATAPENDPYATPKVILADGASVLSSVAGAGTEMGEANHDAGATWAWSTWYSWKLPAAAVAPATVTVDLCGSQPVNALRLAVLLESAGRDATPLATTTSGCTASGTTAPRLSFEATPGTTYRFALGSAQSAA